VSDSLSLSRCDTHRRESNLIWSVVVTLLSDSRGVAFFMNGELNAWRNVRLSVRNIPSDAICFADYTRIPIYIMYIKIYASSSRLLGQFSFNCKQIMRIYKHAKLSRIIFINEHGSGPPCVRVCVSS